MDPPDRNRSQSRLLEKDVTTLLKYPRVAESVCERTTCHGRIDGDTHSEGCRE